MAVVISTSIKQRGSLMKCNDVQNKILQDEDLSDPDVKMHLTECRVCMQFQKDCQRLVEEPFEVTPSDELDEKVLTAVREANSDDASVQTHSQQEVAFIGRRQHWLRLAVAASVVMGVAIATLLLLQRGPVGATDAIANNDHNTEQSSGIEQMTLIARNVLSEQAASEADEEVNDLLFFNEFERDLQDFEQQLGTLEENSGTSALFNVSDS